MCQLQLVCHDNGFLCLPLGDALPLCYCVANMLVMVWNLRVLRRSWVLIKLLKVPVPPIYLCLWPSVHTKSWNLMLYLLISFQFFFLGPKQTSLLANKVKICYCDGSSFAEDVESVDPVSRLLGWYSYNTLYFIYLCGISLQYFALIKQVFFVYIICKKSVLDELVFGLWLWKNYWVRERKLHKNVCLCRRKTLHISHELVLICYNWL